MQDKRYYFHPVGYMFRSKENSRSYMYLLKSLRILFVKLFGSKLDVKHTLSDNCDVIFKAFKQVYPLAFTMNYFAHMMNRNLCKYTCKLNNRGKCVEIKIDLNKISDLAHKEDFLKALDFFSN